MALPPPTTGVVVLNYGDANQTAETAWRMAREHAKVVVVDNDPASDLARFSLEASGITVLRPGRNTGFAGGCNLGIEALADLERVLLLNNDAGLADGALRRLEAELERDPTLGAVVPKTCFPGEWHEVELVATSTWRPGRGDQRDLAWQPKRFLLGERDCTDRVQLVEGFWEPGRGGRWAGQRAIVRVPALADLTRLRIELATPPRRAVELTVDGRTTVRVEPGVGWAEVALDGERVTVIANAGNARREDGYGLDVGRYEADRGQHDDPRDVEAWCGGAVLLRSEYLRDAGAFDERLFLYYEDLELSLRGAARGWRYRLVPQATAWHDVGSSARRDATRSEVLRERNRLLVLARHGSLRRLAVELVRFVAVTLRYVQREIVAPPLRGAAPCGWLVKVRGLALGGALVRLPGQLASRGRDRRLRRTRRGIRPLA